MRHLRAIGALALAVLVFFAAQAATTRAYFPQGQIQIPGGLASMDISWGSAVQRQDYVADRTNSAIDVINMSTDTFVGRISSLPSTPNGVFSDDQRGLVYYANTDSTFHVASATTLQNISSISTGGPGRADEGAYDPKDKVAVIANDQATPPFNTFIDVTNPAAPAIIAKTPLPTATAGIEQAVWVPQLAPAGLFVQAIPAVSGGKGALFEFSPAGALVGTIPLDCAPAGNALGIFPLEFVGCTPAPEMVNLLTGVKVATLGTAASSDEVWFDQGSGTAQFLTSTPSALNIYSGTAPFALVEMDPINSAFHNLAADAVTKQVFVALRPPSAVCAPGCVAPFSPTAAIAGIGGVNCLNGFNPSGTNCGTVGAPGAGGVTCGGIFYPSGTTCGPIPGGTLPGGTGVTCGGIFYPSGTLCAPFTP